MEKTWVLKMDGDHVRFTPDGRVSILDAIGALMGPDQVDRVWERMKSDHPYILNHCRNHRFPGQSSTPVVDSSGWDKICGLLVDYWMSQSAPAGAPC
jgi:hypothetical protein